MVSASSILLSFRRYFLLPAAILVASVSWIHLASAQTAHSSGAGSTGQPLSSDLLKLIKPGPFRQDNYRVSDDGTRVTFRYRFDLTNGTNYQLSEVDIAMSVVGKDPKNELYRSKVVRFTDFTNYRIPHKGSLEARSSLASYLSGDFTIPAHLWAPDVRLPIVVTRAIALPEGGDLHDLGNLIQFMRTHTEPEIRRAFEHDPKLALVQDGGGTNACLAALACSTPGVVDQIMNEGGDIHSKPGGAGDAMFLATASDQPENLQFALQQGFSVNSDSGGSTPLEVGIVLHANKSVAWLIAHGANINAVDSQAFVPLAIAIERENAEAFDMVAAAGPDAHHLSNGATLMQIAALHPAFLAKVVALGVGVDEAPGPSNMTPLMYAALFQSYDGARWLLDHGANIDAKDEAGRNVFDYAQMSNTLHTDMFFRQAVGDPSVWRKRASQPKLTPASAQNKLPAWKNGVIRFDCSLDSFQSELSYAPPIRGALQNHKYTINAHLRTPFDLHEWSTACVDTSSHSSIYPNIVFCHSDDAEHVVWKTTVKVIPNTRYVFSCWAYGVADPLQCHSSLILKISGSASERSYVPFSRWGKFDQIWLSGDTTSATLEIVCAKEARDHIFGISDVTLEKL